MYVRTYVRTHVYVLSKSPLRIEKKKPRYVRTYPPGMRARVRARCHARCRCCPPPLLHGNAPCTVRCILVKGGVYVIHAAQRAASGPA